MKRKALLCATLMLPAMAQAQDFGIPPGTLDLFYLPNANIETRQRGTPSTDIKGDGFGLRALAQASDLLLVSAEYQTTSYDTGAGDRDDIRAGVGLGGTSGPALLAEYLSLENGDGFGAHVRLGMQLGERSNVNVRGGYVQVEDTERFGGFEFGVGASYSFLEMFGFPLGAFADYRVTSLEGSSSQRELKLRDLRVGVRLHFGGRGDMPAAGEDPVGVEPVSEDMGMDTGAEEPGMVPVEDDYE
jgi:hypothetical protein